MLYALLFGFDLLIALHAYRTGRPQYWPFIILFFPGLGAFAYFVFEIMPELIGPNSPRAIKSRASKSVDALTLLQGAERDLAQVDTALNQIKVGDAHFALGAFNSAADHYRFALDRVNGRDAKIETKLAQALFEGGRYAEALTAVERQETPIAIGEADRLSYLRARILSEMGRGDEALALYADITTRLPGEEPRCRYAALLIEQGKRGDALTVLSEVHKGLAKLRAQDKLANAAMFRWAEDQYQELRT